MSQSRLKLLTIGYLLLHCTTNYGAALPSCANTNLNPTEINKRADAFLKTSNVRILYENKLPQVVGGIASTVGFLASLGLANSGAVVFRSPVQKTITDQVMSYIKPLAPYATGAVAGIMIYKLLSDNNEIDSDKKTLTQLTAELAEKNTELSEFQQLNQAQEANLGNKKQNILTTLQQMHSLMEKHTDRKKTKIERL